MKPPDDEYGYPKSFQARREVKPQRARSQRPSGPRRTKKKRKVDIAGLLPERDWETIQAIVLARPAGGSGYWKADKFILLEPGRCERCGRQRASDAHHRKLVSEGGPDVISNLAALCRECHDWCHRNVEAARGLGFIVRGRDWRVKAIQLWDGSLVTLDDDGMYPFQGWPKK